MCAARNLLGLQYRRMLHHSRARTLTREHAFGVPQAITDQERRALTANVLRVQPVFRHSNPARDADSSMLDLLLFEIWHARQIRNAPPG